MNRRRSETAPLLGAYHRRYSTTEDERRDSGPEVSTNIHVPVRSYVIGFITLFASKLFEFVQHKHLLHPYLTIFTPALFKIIDCINLFVWGICRGVFASFLVYICLFVFTLIERKIYLGAKIQKQKKNTML